MKRRRIADQLKILAWTLDPTFCPYCLLVIIHLSIFIIPLNVAPFYHINCLLVIIHLSIFIIPLNVAPFYHINCLLVIIHLPIFIIPLNVAPFYHIRAKECTKYATLLHCRTGQKYRLKAERHCSLLVFFLALSGLEKILRNSQNICAYYMLKHRIRCMYCVILMFCIIL